MTQYRVAACQMDTQDEKAKNIDTALDLLDDAADSDADIAALPEMFTFMGDKTEYRSNAEEIPGAATDQLAAKAAEHNMWVHGGSMFEVADDPEKVHNTTVVFNPDGELVNTYRKIHLFDVEIGDEVVTQESARVMPGEDVVTVETDFGNIGLSICYDLRFPELYSSLANRDANLIFVPAAFTKHTGKDHWQPLLRARAIETQSYIVAPGQIGDKPNGVPSYGRSLIVDPWGNVISQASDTEQVVTADINLDHLATIQRELPSLDHKRPDVYDV